MMVLVVMIGGAFGSAARYLVGITFPHGTLIVNLVGCFVLGAVVQLGGSQQWSPELRAAIATGFLGGFTTYSSFNQETLTMFANGAYGQGAANMAITLMGGLAAGALGLAVVKALATVAP